MSEFADYYEELQVSPNADAEVIAKAYKALIIKHHPDHGGDEEKAKRLTGAYYVLSDPTRRGAYDGERKACEEKAAEQERAARSETRPDTDPRRYGSYEDLPPEVIDLILASTLKEMAAATIRTAGRYAVAAGAAVASTVGDGVRERREAREAKSRRANQRLMDRLRLLPQDCREPLARMSDPEVRDFLIEFMIAEQEGKTPPMVLRPVGLEQTTALLGQSVSPTAARAVFKANPSEVVGQCDSCSSWVHVRWGCPPTCLVCGSGVDAVQAVLTDSVEYRQAHRSDLKKARREKSISPSQRAELLAPLWLGELFSFQGLLAVAIWGFLAWVGWTFFSSTVMPLVRILGG